MNETLFNVLFQVWIVYGDGSLGYSVAEFDTFTRHKVKSPTQILQTQSHVRMETVLSNHKHSIASAENNINYSIHYIGFFK